MATWNVLGSSASFPALNPGSADLASISKWGSVLTVAEYQHAVDKERVYIASNATRQTALATGGTSFSDTAPAFILDVAAGTTMVPIRFTLRQGGTVAGAQINAFITADVIARYSSGGTAITARNMKMGPTATARRASAVTVYGTSPTAAAVNTAITLWAGLLAQDVSTLTNAEANRQIKWPEVGEVVPHLVGPASIVIYSWAGTTQPSWFFTFQWVELDS